jgi:hypothetical protein
MSQLDFNYESRNYNGKDSPSIQDSKDSSPTTTTKGFWDDAEVISVYSRAQAIEDGVLVDLSEHSATKEAGIRFPVAVTRELFGILEPSPELEADGQSLQGRLWDLLNMFKIRHAGRHPSEHADEVWFTVLFIRRPGGRPEQVKVWAKCGPGDNMEPVITIMLEGQD